MPPAPLVVNVSAASDASSDNWPTAGEGLRSEDDTLYRGKLAQRWMQESGQAQPGAYVAVSCHNSTDCRVGVKYILDKLPQGFALFGKSRSNDSKHVCDSERQCCTC